MMKKLSWRLMSKSKQTEKNGRWRVSDGRWGMAGEYLRVGVVGNDGKPGFITSGLTPEISSFEVID